MTDDRRGRASGPRTDDESPGLATAYPEAHDSPGLALWQVTNRWQQAQRAALKPFGLTHVQFVLLASLVWMGTDEPVTQRRLADHAATDPMMTSQVLRALERAGLVDRTPHPGDARAMLVEVTPAGRELANRAVVAVEECDDRFFAPLGADGPRFVGGLLRLRDATARITP